MSSSPSSPLFLGLDSSTQSLSAIVIDPASREVRFDGSLNFDAEFPEYGTRNGTLRHDDPRTVHAPPAQWLDALDRLLARIQSAGIDMSRIAAVSGSGQQHGSVYLNGQAPGALSTLDPLRSLKENLDGIYARDTAPIWMDSSTSAECRELEHALGGAAALAEATGSAAFERFTGPQIRKFAKSEPVAYDDTAHIALVSSFLASVLTGRIAEIDHGDGAGMNLMDIRTRDWHPDALAATAPGLREKLPGLCDPDQVLGTLHPYFSKYGLSPDALSVAWSGDNPNSLIGLGVVAPGQVAISLGTSYTFFGLMDACRVDPRGEGHVFVAPTGDYMSLICFLNGSLARETVRDRFGLDWEGFGREMAKTAPGNQGAFLLPYFEPEIVPRVPTPGPVPVGLDLDDPAAYSRAISESQILSMRLHSAWMDTRPDRILITGGSSQDRGFAQIIADIFQCPVQRQEVANSAALGAALRAAHAWQSHTTGQPCDWADTVAGFTAPLDEPPILPNPDTLEVYRKLEQHYAEAEKAHLRPPTA